MNKSVLVVDDDPLIIRLYERLFKKSDINTVGVGTGKEAREKIKASKFDLIVLDIILPDTNGFELLDEIRKDLTANETIVVMFSGTTMRPEIIQKCKERNVQCLTKGSGSPSEIVSEMVKMIGEKNNSKT